MQAAQTQPRRLRVTLKAPHAQQQRFIDSPAPRKIIRAGRRGGKTVGVAILAVKAFLAGRRVLYAAPTAEQLGRFWFECSVALAQAVDGGLYKRNETDHTISLPATEQRLKAKTAWNANTIRGDYADLLILDEWQLMDEDAWGQVGAPMLLDNNGDAVFIYTPPSLHSRGLSKARDPLHAARMYKAAQIDKSGRWEAFHFTSMANPYISAEALGEIARDMTALAYRQEILAEDVEDVPGALWTRALIDKGRVVGRPADLVRIVIGVDPPGGVTECGIVAAGIDRRGHGYVLADVSTRGSPDNWAGAVVDLYVNLKADLIVAEKNFGGDMVAATIRHAAQARGVHVNYQDVSASRGKAIRAEPVAAIYEHGRVHHVGVFPLLEEELTMWVVGESDSPNRLDALVWTLTNLLVANTVARIYV